MKRDELERPEVEKGDTPQEKSILEKLARFGGYTTPASPVPCLTPYKAVFPMSVRFL